MEVLAAARVPAVGQRTAAIGAGARGGAARGRANLAAAWLLL